MLTHLWSNVKVTVLFASLCLFKCFLFLVSWTSYHSNDLLWPSFSIILLINNRSIGQLHLKSIHPLWKILEKCTTGGVWIFKCTCRGVEHASATFEFSPNSSWVYIEFCRSFFPRPERLTYYVLKYDNFKSVEVQGWTPLKILIFLHWTLRPTFTTLLRKCRAISHWMAVPKKCGKCKSVTISLHSSDSSSVSCIICAHVGLYPLCDF